MSQPLRRCNMKFPDNLKTIRKARGLTMKQLADLIGLTESSISQYEAGRRQPDNEGLLRLAEALDTTVGELLGETKKESTSIGDELMDILEACRDRSDLRMLFKLSRDATPDDVRKAISIIQALKNG